MQNEGMDRQTAYDITRREFYRLRQEEEIEKRIAKEEARYVGAYFGQSRVDVGLMLEDHEFENWKAWAGKEAEKRELMKVGTDGGLAEEGGEVLPAEEPEVAVPGA
jgi:small subunit ribosomal protein S23